MSEVKFTRAPWGWNHQDDHIVITADGCYHATVTCAPDGDELGAREAVANAHLIAAAPDLYHALTELLFNSLHGNGLEAQYKTLDKARAAIAKAEGKS